MWETQPAGRARSLRNRGDRVVLSVRVELLDAVADARSRRQSRELLARRSASGPTGGGDRRAHVGACTQFPGSRFEYGHEYGTRAQRTAHIDHNGFTGLLEIRIAGKRSNYTCV